VRGRASEPEQEQMKGGASEEGDGEPVMKVLLYIQHRYVDVDVDASW